MLRPFFIDRAEAGRLLAKELVHYRGTDALILAIPRGGVTVGHALARELGLLLDIALAKQIGHPRNRERCIRKTQRAWGSGSELALGSP